MFAREYVLSCEGFDMEDFLEGLLEPAGPGSSQEIFAADRTTLWVGRVEVPPGRCAAHFRQRDSEDEVICSGGEEFTVAANVSTEVDHVLTCELF